MMTTPETKVHDFFARFPKRTFQKNETLIQIGDTPPAFFIAQGVVAQCDISDLGDKLVVNLYKPGSFVPLMSLLNDLPTEFFFEASEETVVHVAPRRELIAFLEANPDVMLHTLARMSRGLNGLLRRLSKMMGSDAEGRVLTELEIMHERFAADGGDLEMTEADLASQTGLARETVSRVLKRLKKRNVVDSSRGRIRLENFNESQ